MESMSLSFPDVPRRTVLVVDDDPLVRRYLEAQLSRLGCRLSFAHDGHEAMERVEEDRPDLVLLDIVMPGLDGIEVCRRIKGNLATQHIPVIHLTSLGAEAKERSFEAGADDFLNKPVNFIELRSRVRTHLLIQSLQEEIRASQGVHRGWRWEDEPRAKLLVTVADPDLREWAVDKLRGQGHDVAWAEGLRACLERMAGGLPDLLVIGQQLPDGGGADFVRHLRNFVRSRDLPVLLLCAREALDQKQMGLESGPIDYLTVPTNAAELRVRAEVLLREGRLLAGRSAGRIGLERDLMLDPPTGAYSEAFLEAHLGLMLAGGGRGGPALGLIGVGCYQAVAGWLEAKELMARQAARLSALLRPGEALCRVADRTFVLLLPGVDAKVLAARAEALRTSDPGATVVALPVQAGLGAGAVLRGLAQELARQGGQGG